MTGMRDAWRHAFLVFKFEQNRHYLIAYMGGIEMKLQFIEAGEIVATHGVRGEIKLLPWTDGPEFLLDFNRVQIRGKEYRIESCRVQKTCNLMKLVGVDTMEAGQALRGEIVEIYRCDAPADLIFAAELIGVNVFSEGVFLGEITDVLDYPGNKVYVVTGEHTYMIPAVKAFVLSTDIEAQTMQVRIIEGMRNDES